MLGALIVEDRCLGRLFRDYSRLRPQLLSPGSREVKGNSLDERQIDKVVSLLHHRGAVFEVAGIDLGMHTEDEVASHRMAYAEKMTATLSDEHSSDFTAQVWSFRRRLEGFPLQLYIQTQLTFSLIKTVIEHGTLYHSQRNPKELGSFHWVIDAKGSGSIPTNWEDWWQTFILSDLQNDSLWNPLPHYKEGDYSSFARFNAELSPFLKSVIPDHREDDPPALNLNLILQESFRFSSDPEPGLELVDIVTNAARRALSGNLDFAGWRNIPLLMIGRNKPSNIRMVALKPVDHAHTMPWWSTAVAFSRFGRQMLAGPFQAARNTRRRRK